MTLTINAPLGSDSSMMLDGLMSRCTTPHFSAAASARAACSITSKRQRERHWTFAPHFGLERFAFDQFHDVETFAVLFSVVTHSRDVRMVDLRGCARFAQETRSDAGHLRHLSVDDFESDDGIQNRVARAISYRHCSGAELDRKTVRADFYFEVIVLQRSRRQSPACFGLSGS